MALTTVISWKTGGMPLGQITENAQKKWVEAQEHSVKVQHFAGEPTGLDPCYILAPGPRSPEALALSRDKALAYVNTARAALGHEALDELPRGHRAVPSDCVLARAIPGIEGIGGSVTFRHEGDAEKVAAAWAITRQGKVMNTPAVLVRFISEFDHALHPALFA